MNRWAQLALDVAITQSLVQTFRHNPYLTRRARIQYLRYIGALPARMLGTLLRGTP